MATAEGLSAPLDVNNVQGDILVGLSKNSEVNIFFRIKDTKVNEFRASLAALVPLVTPTGTVQEQRRNIIKHKQSRGSGLLKTRGISIAFSKKGLVKIGITDEIGDSAFNKGMLSDAKHLGDSPADNPDWLPEFKQEIHGIIVVTGDSHDTITELIKEIEGIFELGTKNATMDEVLKLNGWVRPGKFRGHEHFGFLDGVSQPAVLGVSTSLVPGQELVRPGIILCGREGDSIDPAVTTVTDRPPWALDGSFLVFRHLPQLVPEFNTFLKQNPVKIDDPSADPNLGSELRGARLVGRWKSGAPVDLTPLGDDASLGGDPSRNDNFRYDPNSQERCPFGAHTRKTNPRSDLPPNAIETHRFIRRGMQFGPEVSAEEAKSGKTSQQRGLLFKCYQSSIVNGFQFVQTLWANNVNFPPKKPAAQLPADGQVGFDAIVGQTNSGTRSISGSDPAQATGELALPTEWVLSKGGEYFFAPSISTLRDVFASQPTLRQQS